MSTIRSHARWQVFPRAPGPTLQGLGPFPPLVGQLLFNRGIRSREEAEAFLSCDSRLSHDPFTLPDMQAAITRLEQAIAQGEKIAVFGDFDVDGVTATALLSRAIASLGARVIPYLPHRVKEGHGLNADAVTQLAQSGVRVLVTVDCGITSPQEVALAASLGIDTIITDHHVPATTLPSAVAVVDPKRPDSRYPFPDLTGAGLALKLAQGLLSKRGSHWNAGLTELAALGTVADVAPLVGENRYIVRDGLRQLNTTANPGLKALYRQASLRPGAIDTEAIGWIIAPRLNAAGRLDDAILSYRLLTAESEAEAIPMAQALEAQNTQRQSLTQEALEEASRQINAMERLEPLLMVGSKEFSPGVIGLVASKLVERYRRPAIALAYTDQGVIGSCRSIPELNIVEALATCAHLYRRFGGHPRAAGFLTDEARLPELRRQLLALAHQKLDHLDLHPTILVDAAIYLATLTGETLRLVQALAPFGEGNPAPVFLSRGVEVAEARPMGSDGQHLRLKLRQGRTAWDAVAFGLGPLPHASRLDVLCTLGMDYRQGDGVLRLEVVDFRAEEA